MYIYVCICTDILANMDIYVHIYFMYIYCSICAHHPWLGMEIWKGSAVDGLAALEFTVANLESCKQLHLAQKLPYLLQAINDCIQMCLIQLIMPACRWW